MPEEAPDTIVPTPGDLLPDANSPFPITRGDVESLFFLSGMAYGMMTETIEPDAAAHLSTAMGLDYEAVRAFLDRMGDLIGIPDMSREQLAAELAPYGITLFTGQSTQLGDQD